MPPVLGPRSPSLEALEVLGRLQREHGDPVGDGEEGDLGPFEELLDHHPAAGLRRGRAPRRGRR